MAARNALVVGAGIAGSTAAHTLARGGWEVTVVERAGMQRSSGAPVDVRGPALPVAERMGVLAELRAAATRTTSLAFVDASGRRVAAVPMRLRDDEIELPRGDLAAVLADAARGNADFRYGDTVIALRDDGNGVDVTFEHAAPRRFDLVVGADGLHSRVRELAFGPEHRYIRHLGLYVATAVLGHPEDDERTVVMHNTPGRAVAVHPARGRAIAAFLFRSQLIGGLDHHDVAQHRALVRDTFAGGSWRVPELLEQVALTDDLYFDAVSGVRLDRWSQGRTVLVGDSAAGASLLGDGSSMAMAGAATLADALGATPDDPLAALRAYESVQRRRVGRRQRLVTIGAAALVPATRGGLAARNLAARLLAVGARAEQAAAVRNGHSDERHIRRIARDGCAVRREPGSTTSTADDHPSSAPVSSRSSRSATATTSRNGCSNPSSWV